MFRKVHCTVRVLQGNWREQGLGWIMNINPFIHRRSDIGRDNMILMTTAIVPIGHLTMASRLSLVGLCKFLIE